MPGLKKTVWLITTFFILTGIFLGVLLSERRPQLPQLVRTQQQKTEATSNQEEWKKEYVRSKYKLVPAYDTTKRYDIEILVAKGGHSLAKAEDMAKILVADLRIENNWVVFKQNKKEIKLMLENPKAVGWAVAKDNELKKAEFRLPYPARKLDGKIYVPVRSVLRLFGYGVRFEKNTGLIYFGYGLKVDDMCLVFERFVDQK
ncbi:copper amine oxidase-like protein [Caldicellulosiruptor bescii]|uniref:Copper amine oxidase-like N-terminal domain-containing protein n=2 Tax=Caldicellulosiruptor bescii TaxID=31899 RepID=B9MNJ7_CALBD|nr:hypothetical protein [Caldicellulosiruptor bescii]ACM61528.1 conserved hypothetical protein [Caldicellulosiruptor bescii DSM 6725]PBC88660.1 copper amine oxidase-like protein [Caldicellulosiruptor bescii]PBC91859.1 copper amine oxidase-like protein [Caldicellulosiruptor bescii]PBD02730.1 copper amine oxidase-like protein [Caldicellulosiruptor bescii]PBD07653.1 copper amine oxidase-like protein [Caldicellulosiruptor bescii]